jgi:hypothetical protein
MSSPTLTLALGAEALVARLQGSVELPAWLARCRFRSGVILVHEEKEAWGLWP